MRIPLGAIAVVALLVTCAIPASAAGRVFIRDSTQNYKHRPDRIKIFAGAGALFQLKNLDPWSHWGKVPARAKGKYRYNTCNPACASGNFARTRAKVRLRHITRCGGRRVYRHVIVRPKRDGVPNQEFHLTCDGFAT